MFPLYTAFHTATVMIDHNRGHRSSVDLEYVKQMALPAAPRLFRHQDLLQTVQHAPIIDQKKLINTLSYTHFKNGTVLVHAKDPQYDEEILLQARLDGCRPEEIVCLWLDGSVRLPGDARVLHMIISDDLSLILVPIQVKRLDGKGFTATLPDKGFLLGKRRVRRHPCRGILVNLTQSGFLARGELMDFSPMAIHVLVRPDAGGSFVWLNQDRQCMIQLYEKQRTLFSGPCRCIRQTGDLSEKELVLIPVDPVINRFQKRKKRTPRLRITPPLSSFFEHPFSKKPVHLDICDLTFTGFSVVEQSQDSVLLPGMIIPGLEIRYAGTVKMVCDAQVIYRREIGNGLIRSGLAILDMDFRCYRQLSHIMVHAGDPQARFAGDIEMDHLWEFLFDTNFIYSRKYQLLQPCREEFKRTYQRLYQGDQDIEAHFTYQRNGRIYGHVSIFRAYQRAWMVHHLAARPLNGKRTGLSVLRNVLRFFNGLYRYPAIGMDYMLFYFRPENRFPDLFFGGFARHLRNPRACSLDCFAYLSHRTGNSQKPFPEGWQLSDFSIHHLPELERFYRNASGGLMLDALPFGSRPKNEVPIEEIYRQEGFMRQCSIHSLTQGESLKAVFIVNHSDVGLNLSELLNGIKAIVVDAAGLSWDVMTCALSHLSSGYATETIPILIYPASYPHDQGVAVDKQYLLWILDSQYGQAYLDYMENKTQLTMKFLLRHLMKKLWSK